MSAPLFPTREAGTAATAALALAALSTVGDWIWAQWIPDGAVIPGVVHGVLFFVALALVLGWAAGSRSTTKQLLVTLPPAGLALAAIFYPLAYLVGYLGSLILTWTGMWLALALLQRRAGAVDESVSRSLLRAFVAALASGLAFWAVSGMWTQPAEETGYWLRLLYWWAAFLPGLLALLFGRRSIVTRD